jgi:hypothetical protein
MLDQQQKITKSKYVSEKKYAALDKKDSDDIINAVAGKGIYDTSIWTAKARRHKKRVILSPDRQTPVRWILL